MTKTSVPAGVAPQTPASRPGTAYRRPRMRGGVAAVLSPYLYLLPAIALVGGLIGFCIVFTANASLYQWDGIGAGAQPIGLANYVHMLNDPVFWASISHTLITAITIPISMFLGLLFAALLHSRVAIKPVLKAALFIPVVISPAIMAPTFRQIFDLGGPVNGLLRAVGLGGLAHAWLADPNTALPVLMLIIIWSSTGFNFLLYYAALTAIDSEMLEAARMDGASNGTIFFRFLIPLTWATSATLILLGAIGVMKIFDVPYLVTQGGPAHATEFLSTYLFLQTAQNYNAGYGSAIAISMVVICVLLAFAQIRQARDTEATHA